LAVIITKNTIVPTVLEECGKKGIKGAIVITAGFKEVDEGGREIKHHTSYKRVIFEIALADIVFSLDNIVSAVSFSNNIAIVILGVLIGTVSMLLITPLVSHIIHKYKSLSTAAYVIVAFIGGSLIVETLTEIHLGEFEKFLVILGILGVAYMYEKDPTSHKILKPIFKKLSIIIGIPYDIFRVVKNTLKLKR
jgi:predicted tellurium resistance membrane protein TerC